MGKIELRELSRNDGSEILAMLREIGPGENGFINPDYAMSELEFRDFLYKNIHMSWGVELQPGWVPQTSYWLLVDDYPVGFGKLRSYLNENLLKEGGHIGYCIRPDERGKGYGNLLLSKLLEKAKEKGIPKALITVNENNVFSRRVVENNGGILKNEEDGKCYYWCELANPNGVREIHMDDYDEIYALWSTTPGVGLREESDSRKSMERYFNRNKGMSFCYVEDGKIIGTILSGHDGRRGYIYHVTVKESCRGKGIGKELVDRSLQILKKEGIRECRLFVFRDNEVGNGFWKSTGWINRDDLFLYAKSN